MPRPPETFTAGAFAPFSPILPVPLDQPPPGFERPQPRRWMYRPGYNLPVGEPGSDGYKLTSFATMKSLADAYSILRTCLEIRKNEIRALDWDIALTPDAAKAYRGDRKAMRDFGERRAKVKKFFNKPDPNYFTFSSWLHAMMDQVFVYDALSLYLCPTKARGRGTGVLGSGLDSMWLIDGSSIRPLVDLHGGIPRPPAPGYEQYGYGVPRSDFTTMFDGSDLKDAGFTQDDLKGEFRGDQLLYLPYLQRPDSPYGFSLVEQAVIPIMTGLRKQAFQLSYFDESTIPSVYISPGDVNMTANQIRELQDALNAIAGDINWRYKVIVLPPGSKTMPQKDVQIVDQSDEWIATEVCMVANINPMEVGILPRVSTVASPFAAREMAQAQKSIHARTSTKPTLKFDTEIFDVIIQNVLAQQDMRFIFSGMEEETDLAAATDMKIKQVQAGISSIDEARDALNAGPPWGTDETSGPVIFTAAGPLPLGQGGTDSASDQMAAEGGSNESLTDAHAASEGARNAITGNTGSSAAAAGTSGRGRLNGPVTQRQQRRGGALAPAHSTAEGAPGASGGPSAKAASAELEALARHLRKGMPVTQWEPRNLPAVALAVISEDLAKGLSVDQSVDIARTLVLGKAAHHRHHRRDRDWRADEQEQGAAAQAAQAQQQAQARQQRMAQLARQYAPQITQALSGLAKAILKLVRAWMAGTLAVTAAVLASMIRDLVAKALRKVLPSLWRDAWTLGGGTTADDLDWQAQIAQWGIGTIDAISDTKIDAVMALIAQGVRERQSPRDLAARIRALLDFTGRADMIARSEIARAVMAATLRNFRDTGVTYVTWHVHSQHPCAKCLKAQASPPLPLGTPFPGVLLPTPPSHPRCMCSLLPAQPPKTPVTAKALRRRVGLNGEAFLAAFAGDEDGNAAGGGASSGTRHLADGTPVPGGSAGVSPGGEPPRWDGSEPFPGERWIDGGQDGEQGGPRDSGTPATQWPSPHYMDGHWPQGGHGTQQAPASSPGATTGRPPNSVGKAAGAAARFLEGAPKVKASVVYKLMSENFSPDALKWVKGARWAGPVEVPLSLIDFSSADRWAAHRQKAKVDDFARQLKAGGEVNPVILTVKPGHNHARCVDGHHRVMACKKLGRPVRAYVAFLDKGGSSPADRTYLQQFHAGDDPANKGFTAGAGVSPGAVSGLVPFDLQGQRKGPYVAGLMVRAADTGRVLMLQRSLDDDQDYAAGKWEPPGGHAEPGETLLQAALREFAEETGMQVPRGSLTGSWDASNGIYRGFVLTVPSEDSADIFGDRDEVFDPDDPHGDHVQAIAWFDPSQFAGNPSMRPEMGADLPLVLEALNSGVSKSAQTPALEATPHLLGPHGLWHTPDRHVPSRQKLPNYVEHIAAALMRDQGLDESTAIAYAINAIKRWAAGDLHWGHGRVTPEVRAASQRALAEWEQLRASHAG